jgi:hypothetical protein
MKIGAFRVDHNRNHLSESRSIRSRQGTTSSPRKPPLENPYWEYSGK